MKTRSGKLINYLITSLLFSLAVSLIFVPWLYSMLKLFSLTIPQANVYIWAILVIIISSYLSHYLVKINKQIIQYVVIIIFILIQALILWLLQWSILLFIPIFLILVLTGMRFRLYYHHIQFNQDLFWGILFFIIDLALNNKLNFGIEYENIILFFAAVISLTILFNLRDKSKKGYSNQSKMTLLVIVTFILIVSILSLLLGIPLNGPIIRGFLHLLSWIYHLFADLILLLLYPIVRLLSPLLEWIMKLAPDKPRENEREMPEVNNQEELDKLIQPREQGPGLLSQYLPYILWGLFIALLIFIVIYIVKKYHKNHQDEDKKGYIEERESVFSLSEFQQDLHSFWEGLKNTFGLNRYRKRYQGNSPVIIIREIYYRFLCKYVDQVNYNLYNTPNEYLNKLENKLEGNEQNEDMEQLTKIYNQARYAGKASQNEVEKARQSWGNIKDRKK